MHLYFTDQHHFPLPAGHKFPLSKYRLLRESLSREPGIVFHPAPLIDIENVQTIHTPDYVNGFLHGTLPDPVMRRIGFPWSPELVTRTLASAGATLAAARDALAFGIAGTLAGGTHHAFRDEGAGFCVFNDLAIAIAVLRREGAIGRAAILDLDVHQGDGTAKIFADDPETLTISVHGQTNFPFRKQVSKHDIALTDGAGDVDYLTAVKRAIPLAMDFKPDLVLFQSGVDALATDRLGKLSVTPEGMHERDRLVIAACRCARVPLVITLGGGYSEPIAYTVAAHANTFRTARDFYSA